MQKLMNFEKPPLVTFFIMTYNQENYIKDACIAAFNQDYENLEIVISDDASTDNTYSIIHSLVSEYKGKHKIILNRNPKNLGLINHVNLGFKMSSGELIVYAPGDDISLSHRVSVIVREYLKNNKSALLLHSSVYAISELDNTTRIFKPPLVTKKFTLLKASTSRALYIGAAGAWNRKLYEIYGDIKNLNTYDDLTIGFRAFILDKIVYIDKPLVYYRENIGISKITNNELDSGDKKIKLVCSTIKQRIKKYKLHYHTLKQRILDVYKINKYIYIFIIFNMFLNLLLTRIKMFFWRAVLLSINFVYK